MGHISCCKLIISQSHNRGSHHVPTFEIGPECSSHGLLRNKCCYQEICFEANGLKTKPNGIWIYHAIVDPPCGTHPRIILKNGWWLMAADRYLQLPFLNEHRPAVLGFTRNTQVALIHSHIYIYNNNIYNNA